MKIGLTVLFLLALTTIAKSYPDFRDSVIIESKTVQPISGACASAGLKIRVYITNKDSLANITLPLESKITAGAGYATLSRPAGCGARTAAAVFDILLPAGQLPTRIGNFNNYHSNSPDTFLWAGTHDPTDAASKVPQNATRVPLLDIKFDSVGASGLGQVQLDSSLIAPASTIQFVDRNGNKIEVSFVKGFINVCNPASPYVPPNCPASSNLLYGRTFSYDFDTPCSPVTWSVVSGPGTINLSSGLYGFSGQCPLGRIPITVRAIGDCGGCNPSSIAAECSFSLNVIDNPPVCSTPATITFSHGALATNQLVLSDPDASDVLTTVQLNGPGTTNSSGNWSYQTSCTDITASPQTVRVKVFDRFGSCNPGPAADTCEFQLVVTNAAPTVSNCPSSAISAPPNVPLSLQLNGSDADPADAGNLTFTLLSGPNGLTVSPSGLVQWTPTSFQTGIFSACVQITDLCGATSRCYLNFNGIKGDLNGDGALSPVDVVLALNCIFLGIEPQSGFAFCDVNCDGLATSSDIVVMLNVIFLGTLFPC